MVAKSALEARCPEAEQAGFLTSACDNYSLFGSLGNGFGGLTMKCRADGNLRHLKPNKVQIYPGGWVHNLKAQGMLVVKPPWGAKNHWVLQQKVKVQETIDTMLANQRKSFGGVRVEFRCKCQATGWDDQKVELKDMREQLLQGLRCIMLELSHILAHAQQGLNEAKTAGMFKARRSELRSTMPQWKSSGYNRLLHRLGASNPWGNRGALSAERAQQPWREPEPVAVVVPVVPALESIAFLAGQELPDWVPRVVATYTNGFSVATLGQSEEAKAIDWQRLADDLGQPPDIGILFADVAVKTKWRRMPMGRGHRNCPSLSATMTESNGRCYGQSH